MRHTPQQRIGKKAARSRAIARQLHSLTAEKQETILEWLEGADGDPLSFSDATKRAVAEFGLTLRLRDLPRWAEPLLLARRFARALSQSASLVDLTPENRAFLYSALKDRTALRVSAILDSQSPSESSDKRLASLLSTIDSCKRTELAHLTHDLATKAQVTKESDLALRLREQCRKDDALNLEREKFEDMRNKNDKAREALKTLKSKGGIPPEWARTVEDALCGISPE